MTGPRFTTVAAIVAATACFAAARADDEAGRSIYRDGRLPGGAPLRGVLSGDVALRGFAASCSRCHRPSGFGSTEGASFVPPVTGPSLFSPRRPRRADLIRGLYQDPLPQAARASPRTPRDRPAYDVASLVATLRTGVDPSGRSLDPLMPRYDLDDADAKALVGYLKTLGASDDPGVDGRELHLATVVSSGVDPERRRAMLDVVEAFVLAHNLGVRRELARPGFSPHYKGEYRGARREWVHHVWELDGPAETWGSQLDALSRRRPVFALVGGAVNGGWGPIHRFSERTGAPCLFPLTDLPVVAPDEGPTPTLYLSRGLPVEAQSLGVWLSDSRPGSDVRFVQVYRRTESGEAMAKAFRSSLRDDLRARLDDRPLSRRTPIPGADFWNEIGNAPSPLVLVLWLTPQDYTGLRQIAPHPRQELYFSGGLLEGDASAIPERVRRQARLTYPFALPGQEEPEIYRARAWLRSRKVARDPERWQLATFFAMSVLEHATVRMFDHFSRDYLVECIEHEAENAVNPGLFPRMSLGPGQRFASKGCFIVEPSRDAVGNVNPISPWIVP